MTDNLDVLAAASKIVSPELAPKLKKKKENQKECKEEKAVAENKKTAIAKIRNNIARGFTLYLDIVPEK